MMITVSNPVVPPHLIQQYSHQYQNQQNDFPRRQQQQSQAGTAALTFQDFSIPTIVDSSAIDNLPDDLMQPEPWGVAFAPCHPSKMSRTSHKRDSSLSSLGSTGPASPFSHNISTPQIAITDSSSDGLPEMHGIDGSNSSHTGGGYYQITKPHNGGSFPGYHISDALSEMAYPVTVAGPNNNSNVDAKSHVEQCNPLLPAPDFTNSTPSHPASVASSVADDSPATPTMSEAELSNKRRRVDYGEAPKLGRTLTDVYSDELYSPNFTITSTSPSQPVVVAPNMDLFRQRLSAANTQHLNDVQSPTSSRSRDHRASPFRTGSPHAPILNSHSVGNQRNTQFNGVQGLREQEKALQGAKFFIDRHVPKIEPEVPKTISPKDAMLDYKVPKDEARFTSLFPQESTALGMAPLPKLPLAAQILQPLNGGNQLNYMPQLPMTLQVPQQLSFYGRQHCAPSRPSSIGSSESTGNIIRRPLNTAAEGGTYTCTYHGCTLRFETPALLQKHKREGHRQIQSLGRPHELSGIASGIVNSQAGPHRCDRINPSTGKPCKTVFSRPYDLTRHEDTIHNARKQKVRCNLCTEEKTFSRADALTRHYRVCHPDQELPGKHRRRGGG